MGVGTEIGEMERCASGNTTVLKWEHREHSKFRILAQCNHL